MTEMMLDVRNCNDIPFRIVYGERVYLDGSVSPCKVVAFYDRRYDFTEYGQFVADYDMATLLEKSHKLSAYGLNLYGGEEDWSIDSETMQLIIHWLRFLL